MLNGNLEEIKKKYFNRTFIDISTNLGIKMPRIYHNIDFNFNQAQKDHELVKKKNGLYIVGNVGTGKTLRMYNYYTYLRILAINLMLPITCSKIFSTPAMFSWIREDIDEHLYRINKLKEYDYLFIDDFGTEKGTEFEIDTLYQIIDFRWLNKKNTIISTNLSPDEWIKNQKNQDLAKRIVDRLRSMTSMIEMLGESRR